MTCPKKMWKHYKLNYQTQDFDGWWQDQINMMLDIGKKAEQQSLAKYGLDFVTDTYLPEKLGELGLA